MKIEKDYAVGTIEEISMLIANEICNRRTEFAGVDCCMIDADKAEHIELDEVWGDDWFGIKRVPAFFDSDEEYFASDYYGGGCYVSRGIYTKGKDTITIAQGIAGLIRESIGKKGISTDENTMILAEILGDNKYWSDPQNRELRLNVDFFMEFLPGESEQEAIERIRQMLSEAAQKEETEINFIIKNREVRSK